MLTKTKTSSGFGLVEVMVSVGLMSMITVTMLNFTQGQSEVIKRMQIKNEIEFHRQTIYNYLNDPEVCYCNFQNKKIDDLTDDKNPYIFTEIKYLSDKSDTTCNNLLTSKLYTTSPRFIPLDSNNPLSPNAKGSLYLYQMRMLISEKNIAADRRSVPATVTLYFYTKEGKDPDPNTTAKIDPENSKNAMVSKMIKKSIPINLSFDSNKKIEKCQVSEQLLLEKVCLELLHGTYQNNTCTDMNLEGKAVTINGDLTVNRNIIGNENLEIEKRTILKDELTVEGDSILNGIEVRGVANIKEKLTVNDQANFKDDVNFSEDLTVDKLTVKGNAEIDGDETINGTLYIK